MLSIQRIFLLRYGTDFVKALRYDTYFKNKPYKPQKIKVQFFRLSTLGSWLNSNILNLNILEKDNIVCVLLINITMRLNSIREPNVLKLRIYT